jgi:hypothetical protein
MDQPGLGHLSSNSKQKHVPVAKVKVHYWLVVAAPEMQLMHCSIDSV